MATATNAILLIFIITFSVMLAYSNASLSYTQTGQTAQRQLTQIQSITNTTNDQIVIFRNSSFVGTIAFDLPLTWVFNAFKSLVSIAQAPWDIVYSLDIPPILKQGLAFLLSIILLFALMSFWRIGYS